MKLIENTGRTDMDNLVEGMLNAPDYLKAILYELRRDERDVNRLAEYYNMLDDFMAEVHNFIVDCRKS